MIERRIDWKRRGNGNGHAHRVLDGQAAYDQKPSFADVPDLETARSPMPRTDKPPHVTPTETETSQDDLDEIAERAHELLRSCIERGIPTAQLESVIEALFPARAADAGPTPQTLVDDQSKPLGEEVIAKVLEHLDGRLSPSALDGLRDMLSSGPDQYDWMPPGLRGHESEIERVAEGKDARSVSDLKEVFDHIDAIAARELMPGSGDKRRRVAGDQPPPFPGRPTPGGYPLPPSASPVPVERHKPVGADRRRMARDVAPATAKQFAKFLGLRKRDLPKVAW